MRAIIRCDCGFKAEGEADDEVVAAARAHARRVHHAEMPTELTTALLGSAGAARLPLTDHSERGEE